jgi:hypothetical protein
MTGALARYSTLEEAFVSVTRQGGAVLDAAAE